jgi:RNA polymerase sigma-70 factor, ECF subfamily
VSLRSAPVGLVDLGRLIQVDRTSFQMRADPPPTPSFRDLVEAHSADLLQLALRLLANEVDAEDALQDAWERALTHLAQGHFRGEALLTTWLYRIVTNVCLDRLRRGKHRQSVAERSEPAVDGSAERRIELRDLAEALSALPLDQRAALVLKELHGQSAREVAQILERSEGAVEQLLVRARATLRRRLEP